MAFLIDKQTLDDLNIMGKHKAGSIFSLFNHVQTRGGERLLESMFQYPLTDFEKINERSGTICRIQATAIAFPPGIGEVQLLDDYLAIQERKPLAIKAAQLIYAKFAAGVLRDDRYTSVQAAMKAAAVTLATCQELATQVATCTDTPDLSQRAQRALTMLSDQRLVALTRHDVSADFPLQSLILYDHLLGTTLADKLRELLAFVYEMDVYIALATVARKHGYRYANALPPSPSGIFDGHNLRHPSLPQAVGNDLHFNANHNLLFLTGANMAGKSTLMKAFGTNLYLAHLGFPVAADSLSFSVRDGLFSSINVTDDLHQGYSHYYAEVKRVKKVAEAVSQRKNLVIIFDELFKGTNVKDAHDATLAVTEALAKYSNSFFVISTHIIEVGESLKTRCPTVRFARLPSYLDGSHLRYTYLLEDGITADRHGMRIIEQEGIINLILS